MSRNGINRRDFIKTGLTAAAVLPVAGALLRAAPARDEEEKLVTELPDQTMVTALQYTNKSETTDQDCKNCQFFTPQGDAARGKCQLFPVGLVTSEGWCASWVAKAT